MENHGNLSKANAAAIGFCLLPSELIQNILLYLALPEIMHVKSLNKSIADIVSCRDFVREYNSQSSSRTWLFVYKKRWHRDAILHGFTDQSNRWFSIQIASFFKLLICPGENIYFLTASGNFFLFVCNTRREVIAVNFVTKTVKRIPSSPLGPRGTSSWRRSGMKLVSGPDHFRFLFAELVDGHPVLFVYSSETDRWQSVEAREEGLDVYPRGNQVAADHIFLNVVNGPHESMVIAVDLDGDDAPIILRPRFYHGQNGRQPQSTVVGFSLENIFDRMYVYGDGQVLIIKSKGGHHDDVDAGVRTVNGIELWGLGLDGRHWVYLSKVPCEIVDQIKKPYRVMRGCLQRRNGIIRVCLLSNFEGSWDIIWLSYDIKRSHWTWVPLPEYKTTGLNMAGIAFSSGLTLS
ncbi:hypothetical protein Tsubulata_042417 [Turnera subulata]|uniref:F-box domain-containing protein n=1 Tax=Turnera subulata TaxID=218843 RepID=A0A9Q0G8S4_9ROSI|nr:hypothetical protein Tsubulata_042417 [Turnera subulata]